ncbi:MAG: hypothetical protein N3D84_03330 [Candidatus Woesearchaeota archaeon]|nr:hypothetical protein [Candidatus Woesearchaeota archaeon]
MKGYNRRTAIDPFEEKKAIKDNSFRNLVVFLFFAGLVIFLVL